MPNDFAEKKESFFDYKKNQNFSKSKKSPFSKVSLEIMYSVFAEKKETFLTLEKQNFSKSKKWHFFQRSQPMFLAKKCHFFLYLNLIKINLEIMRSDFTEKKETFLTLKNRGNCIFAKGNSMLLIKKMPIFFFIYNWSKQKKTRKNAWWLCRETTNLFFDFNKPCSLKSKTSHFLLLLVKKCQFFVYLDLVKRRLEIMLSDFAEKKETFFWL